VILNDESIEDLDRKVMRTRKNQVHQEMINGRYYTIHRMPIRLGTGSYGVAGIMYDMTEKVLEQTIHHRHYMTIIQRNHLMIIHIIL